MREPRTNRLLIHLIWPVVFYLTAGIGVAATLNEGVARLLGWRGAATAVLLAGSVGLFQAVFLPFFRRPMRSWPMSFRQAALYFGGQGLLLGALIVLDANFVGLAFALMGQVFGALRPRRWPLPLLISFALIGYTFGLVDALRAGEWLSIVNLLFTLSILVVMGLMISQLFTQRYELMDLVGKLREAKAEVEAAVAEREELAVLRERARMSRDLHDNLGHALVSVTVKLEAAERLYARDPARGAAELAATRSLVRETMTTLRRAIADLRAPVPDHHDLPAALRRLAAETTARGPLTVSVEADLDGAGPPPLVAEAFWQIAGEALRNVERHAAAASATLALERCGGGWRLRVSDDGSGIEPADLDRPDHFGIVGMRERVLALDGRLAVGRRPAGGTVVEAEVPG